MASSTPRLAMLTANSRQFSLIWHGFCGRLPSLTQQPSRASTPDLLRGRCLACRAPIGDASLIAVSAGLDRDATTVAGLALTAVYPEAARNGDPGGGREVGTQAQVGAQVRKRVGLAGNVAPGAHRGGCETHGDPVIDFDFGAGEVRGFLPLLASAVDVPRSRHLHVGVQHEVLREADEQVFLPTASTPSMTSPTCGRSPVRRGAANRVMVLPSSAGRSRLAVR